MLIKAEKYEEIELLLINYANSGIAKEKVLNLEGRYASSTKDFERAKKIFLTLARTFIKCFEISLPEVKPEIILIFTDLIVQVGRRVGGN